MFQSAEVISKINFSVSGDLDNPTVTELERNSKQVTIPADALPKPVKPPLATAPTAAGEPVVDAEAVQLSPLLPPDTPAEGSLAPDRPMPEAKPTEDEPVIDVAGAKNG
jgi:hypothetical protein